MLQNPYSVNKVITPIKTSIESGYGIVPLIGSGMSAASGIPAGSDYHGYLFYCLSRVFLLKWDPCSLRWPDYEDVPVYDDLKEEMLNWSVKMIEEARKIKDEDDDKERTAIWQAAGAVSDWRAMLDLLSRLSLGERKEDGSHHVIIKYPDHRIIDSFFVNLTKGKRPNSAHYLLAHMSDILRIKILLTTNFDNLIENTYQALVNPVAVFDVHMDSSLPDAEFTRAQRSVVKMHGGRYGLRADFSLDKYPNTLDVEKFVDYLSYNKNNHGKSLEGHQRNLLVMGIAYDSFRMIALICKAVQKRPELQVFWVCYNDDDINKVKDAFKITIKNLNVESENLLGYEEFEEKNLIICVTPDLSLFLLELYQTLFLSVPPAGVQFNTIWPFPPKSGVPVPNCRINGEISNLEEKIKEKDAKNIWAYSCKNGLISIASEAFYKLRINYNCIWMNLDESYTYEDFQYFIIESLIKKTGRVNLLPTLIDKNSQIKRVLNSSRRKFIFFINCLEIKNDSELSKIIDFANSLNNQQNIIFIFLGNRNILENKDDVTIKEYDVTIKQFKFIEPKVTENISKDEYFRFAISLSLIRHTAYLSLLISWSFIKAPNPLKSETDDSIDDNDSIRFEKAKTFLKWLRECNAIQDDDGYFVYMPPKIRDEIRKIIKTYYERDDDFNKIKAESFQGIADWYMKLFRASGDIQASLESIYHRIQCYKINIERFKYTSLNEAYLTVELIKQTINTSFHSITLKHVFNEIINEIKNIGIDDGFGDTLNKIKNELEYIVSEYCENILQNGKDNDKANANDKILIYNLSTNATSEVRFDIKEAAKLLEQVKQKIHYRDYDEANKLIIEILEINEISFSEIIEKDDSEEIRKSAYLWVIEKQKYTEDVYQKIYKYVIEVLRQLQFLKLYCSYFEVGDNKEKFLKDAEKIYLISTEIMRYINDNEFLNRENAFLRSSIGIVLSNMNRHHEAYRKYNEAYGYLNFGVRPDEPLKFAIIDLRRGETFLCKLDKQKINIDKGENEEEKRKKLIKRFGVIYDAIASIDRGEYRMKGYTIHARWLAWMYELQLQLCVEIVKFRTILNENLNPGQGTKKYDFSSHCRDCEMCGKRFIKNLENGIDVAGEDILRYTRYYEHIESFIDNLEKCNINEKINAANIVEVQKTCKERIDNLKKK